MTIEQIMAAVAAATVPVTSGATIGVLKLIERWKPKNGSSRGVCQSHGELIIMIGNLKESIDRTESDVRDIRNILLKGSLSDD